MLETAGHPLLQTSITRSFDAPRERVFKFFTDPEAIKRWWVPEEGTMVRSVELDLRVGGTYCLTMDHPAGMTVILRGTYLEVRPPEKLVYTFCWDNMPDIGETLVTVEFRERGVSTEMVLTHERLRDPAYVDFHVRGWSAVLNQFATLLTEPGN